MKVFLNQDPHGQGEPLFARDSFIIHPGLSFFVGCNGSGKTSLLSEVEKCGEAIEDCKVINFNNYHVAQEGKSEGELEAIALTNFTEAIAEVVKTSSKGDKIVAVADLSHSGLTVESATTFKHEMNVHIVPDASSAEVELYVLVAAIDYEFLLDQQSIDVQTFNVLIFNNYVGYKKYIMNSKLALDKRYKKLEGK